MRALSFLVLVLACSACSSSRELPADDTPVERDAGAGDVSMDVGQNDSDQDASIDAASDAPLDASADTPLDAPPETCPPAAVVECDGVDDDCDGDSEEGVCEPPIGTAAGLFFEPDDYVELSGSGLDLGTGAFTVEVWYTASPSSASGAIAGNRPIEGPDPGLIWWIDIDDPLQPRTTINSLTIGATGVDPGTQFYSALTRSASGDIGYGTSLTTRVNIQNRPGSVTAGPWRLGQTAVGEPSFTGVIHRLRIWSIDRPADALSPDSVDATETEGLVAELDFSEGEGQSVTSRIGEITGQLGSTSGEDDNDPMWVSE